MKWKSTNLQLNKVHYLSYVMHRITNVYRVKSHAQYAIADKYSKRLIEEYMKQFNDTWERMFKRNEVTWHHNVVKQKALDLIKGE